MIFFLVNIIQQVPTPTPDTSLPSAPIPTSFAWILFYIILPLAAYFARDIIPWLRSLVDAGFKVRWEAEKESRKNRTKLQEEREERYLKAFEQTAENGRDIAAALKIFSEDKVAETFIAQDQVRNTQRMLALLESIRATVQAPLPSETEKIRPPRRE